MANPEHLAILEQGVDGWNKWRKDNYETKPDLNDSDLQGAQLVGINFRWTSLVHANLDGANLHKAVLTEAILHATSLVETDLSMAGLGMVFLVNSNLSKANLDKANMGRAYVFQSNLSEATLKQVNFSAAHLNETVLSGADLAAAILIGTNISTSNLDGANLANAQIGWTIFANIDLSSVIGLDSVIHHGPSTIGIDTIMRSSGAIPEDFLNGCGVSETFITSARSLIDKPLDFCSCFISHSSKDKRFCERLYADLQTKTVRVWYFPEDAKWGEPVWGEIDRSIKIYDKLIVVCSKNSLTSNPVLREIERALNREDKEHKDVLFPVTLDDYIFDEWEHPRKADVLAKVVGDFRGWNRSATKYDAAFKKLLKALKAA
jgi:TIR domain/Pentapeptide repeats (8 copies)